MNSSEIEQIALSPLVISIVGGVLTTLKTQEVVHEDKQIINADLVPSVSGKIPKPKLMPKPKTIPAGPAGLRPSLPPIQSKAAAPTAAPINDYGKINSLLKDPSIGYIECPGAEKSLSIVRAGQKQLTKISLTSDEIKKLLEKVAEQAHVPLMEGVFRAAIEDFTINGVVSDVIGSRFVIKKPLPSPLMIPRPVRRPMMQPIRGPLRR